MIFLHVNLYIETAIFYTSWQFRCVMNFAVSLATGVLGNSVHFVKLVNSFTQRSLVTTHECWGFKPKDNNARIWFQVVMDTQHLNVWCKRVTMAEYWLQVVLWTSHLNVKCKKMTRVFRLKTYFVRSGNIV